MADILLTVGVDTSLSYAEFQAGITSLVSQVNANPPKIKLKFDDSSLSSMKQQIESMTKAASSANAAKLAGGYTKTNSGIWVKDTAAINANTQAKMLMPMLQGKPPMLQNRLQRVKMRLQSAQRSIQTL